MNALSKCLILVALISSAPAIADVEFTSQPATSASVGRIYSYRMTAAIVDEDDADEEDIRFIARALPPWLEFDGQDTIFGTPSQEDVGLHLVRLRARLKGDHADQDFSINVEAAPTGPPPEGADLAASISVTPESASIGDRLSWRATARNLSDADVANIVLEVAFSGDAIFSIDDVDDSFCSIELRGDLTAVVCRWSPFGSGASRSARVRGVATGAGNILAVATVSIVDAVPIDRNSANDNATVQLRVSDGSRGGGSDDSPVLTLNGPSFITISAGETYEDAGATAMDDKDGVLTSEIVVDNPVDTSVIGRYTVSYVVTDSAGNSSTVTRTVEIVPREAVGGGGGGAVGAAFLLLALFGIFARARRGR